MDDRRETTKGRCVGMIYRALIGPGGVGMSGMVVVVQRDEQCQNRGARVRSIKLQGNAGKWAEGYGR